MSIDLSPTSIEAIEAIRHKAGSNKKIVFVQGNFNIVHPGHLRLLRFAAENGDFLVVGINDHDPCAHLFPEATRHEGVQSINFVNHAFVLRDPVEKFIRHLRPHTVVKGKEHEDRTNIEQAELEDYGGKLLFGSGDISFSSLDLLRREFARPAMKNIQVPDDYLARHGHNRNSIHSILNRIRGLKVAVVGEMIVDEYIACDPLGMSQEDPTIVVTPVASQKFLGGAGIVAAHALSLGAEVDFFSIVGKDETAAYSSEQLKAQGVGVHFLEDESRPTPLKQRFRANGKTLLRVSHLRQHDISKELVRKMTSQILERLEGKDLLIFSDFNYGCLPKQLVDALIAKANSHQIMMAADSQSSSQVGDVSRFEGMTLLTPTEREARLALRDFNSGLVAVSHALQKKSLAKNVIVTLGAEGLLINGSSEGAADPITDRIPALNGAPKDVAGAGDSLLTATAMALASNHDIWQSACFGALAAACQVSRVGNSPLTREDIETELRD